MTRPAVIPPIPHRAPFLFVSGEGTGDRTGFSIDADFDPKNPYVGDGSADPIVPRTLVIEALAQATAVVAHQEFSSTQSGVLAKLSDAEVFGDVRCSEKVELRVKHYRTFAKLWWYGVSAVKKQSGELLASAQVVVAHLGAAT